MWTRSFAIILFAGALVASACTTVQESQESPSRSESGTAFAATAVQPQSKTQPQSDTTLQTPSKTRAPRSQTVPKGTGVLVSPRPIAGSTPTPPYPQAARLAGRSGVTVLRATIDIHGNPIELSIEESSGHQDLDDASRQTAARWKFHPATWCAEPIEYDVLLPFRFELKDSVKE